MTHAREGLAIARWLVLLITSQAVELSILANDLLLFEVRSS